MGTAGAYFLLNTVGNLIVADQNFHSQGLALTFITARNEGVEPKLN